MIISFYPYDLDEYFMTPDPNIIIDIPITEEEEEWDWDFFNRTPVIPPYTFDDEDRE